MAGGGEEDSSYLNMGVSGGGFVGCGYVWGS